MGSVIPAIVRTTKEIQMKMKRIIALAAFAAIGVQAGNIATDGVIGNMTVGAGDWWQPGVGVGSMDTILNLDGGTFDGSGLTDFVLGRAGAKGHLNISAGTAILGNLAIGPGTGVIDFTTGSTEPLTISGTDQTFYEGLFTAGSLTHAGSNQHRRIVDEDRADRSDSRARRPATT